VVHRLPPLRVTPHVFTAADLCGGHVVLDLVNTAAGLNRDPRDWLDGYPRLVGWAVLAGLVGADDGERLLALARQDPAGAGEALARVRELRAALYALVHAGREGVEPPADAVAGLERWCRRAGAALTLRGGPDGAVGRSFAAAGLDLVAVLAALAAADFLSAPLAGRVGLCGGRNCGWVFLDTSRSRRRRWCDMKTCGNAAKASRHYHRSRA
jgi:predicted RNA-binding Zn ribbon-like protein